MEEKITVTTYLIMHLTLTDFAVGFLGAQIRVLANYSKAKHKIKAASESFDNALYFKTNWDKILYGNVAGLGLLFIVPEIIIHASEWLFGREVAWNSGFSGLIGLAGVEVVAGLIQRTKQKFTASATPDEPIS